MLDLSNVPWDLSAYHSVGDYGNNAPPRNYAEWNTFIEALCRKLVELYGAPTVGKWSFRMGAEPNGGPSHTWHDTHDEYVKMYDATADAVKRVVPTARFGPGEFSGRVTALGPPPPIVNYVKLFQHCTANRVPFEFLANSSHEVPVRINGRMQEIDPERRVEINLTSYRNILGPRQVPVYIFQFGLLDAEFPGNGSPRLPTNEPGGRGAAWTFHVLMSMKEREPRLKGVWHWDTLEALVPGQPERSDYLLYGNGWLYAVLDACIGGDAYLLGVPESAAGTMFKVLFVRQERECIVVLSSFNPDRKAGPPETVGLHIPQSLIDAKNKWRAQAVTLTDSNSVYGHLRADLMRQELLKPEYQRVPLLAQVRDMGKPGALAFVRQHFDTYERTQIESLTLKPFSGSLQAGTQGLDLSIDAPPDSVTALRLSTTA